MMPDFPIDIRIRLAELIFFHCTLTLLTLYPVGCLSLEKLNWDSQQGRDLATSGCNKKNQLSQSYSYINRKVWHHQIWIQNNLGFMVSDLIKIQHQIQKRLKAENSARLQRGPWFIWRILWKAPRSWSGHVVHYNKVWKRAILQQGCLCSLSRIPDLIHLTGNGGHQFISIATPLVQGVRGTAHLVACVFQAYSQCENHSVKILVLVRDKGARTKLCF